MNNKQKNGITISSLVIYLVIFTIITTIVSVIYTNMNDTLFVNRGAAINYTAFNKLQYNITASALKSDNVESNEYTIIYSNGDSYEYNDEKDIVLLNGGILCTNVTSFEPIVLDNNTTKQLTLNLTFNKYSNEVSKNIISSVEVE